MIVRIYSLCIMLYDFTYFFMYAIYLILTTLWHVIKPPSSKKIDKDVALIIGSSYGIGQELALEISKLGTVIVCLEIMDKNSLANEKLVKYICENGGTAYSFLCNDITDKTKVENILHEIYKLLGKITIFFHCYSIPTPKNIILNYNSQYYTEWKVNSTNLVRSSLDNNILSYFLFLNIILPKMKNENRGHIVLFTSAAGLTGAKQHETPLCVSQFAIQGLYETILDDLRITKEFSNHVHVTLCHIYPFMVNNDDSNDARIRIPYYFGTMHPNHVAKCIIKAVLQNSLEISVPWHIIYISNLLKLLPKRVTLMIRNLLDTGIDFC